MNKSAYEVFKKEAKQLQSECNRIRREVTKEAARLEGKCPRLIELQNESHNLDARLAARAAKYEAFRQNLSKKMDSILSSKTEITKKIESLGNMLFKMTEVGDEKLYESGKRLMKHSAAIRKSENPHVVRNGLEGCIREVDKLLGYFCSKPDGEQKQLDGLIKGLEMMRQHLIQTVQAEPMSIVNEWVSETTDKKIAQVAETFLAKSATTTVETQGRTSYTAICSAIPPKEVLETGSEHALLEAHDELPQESKIAGEGVEGEPGIAEASAEDSNVRVTDSIKELIEDIESNISAVLKGDEEEEELLEVKSDYLDFQEKLSKLLAQVETEEMSPKDILNLCDAVAESQNKFPENNYLDTLVAACEDLRAHVGGGPCLTQ